MGYGSPCYGGALDRAVLRTTDPIFLWVSLKELTTRLRDEMGTPDEELAFLAEVSAGYQWPQSKEEFKVGTNNDPGAFCLMVKHARLPSASLQIKVSASWLGFWYALYFAWANRQGYVVPWYGSADDGSLPTLLPSTPETLRSTAGSLLAIVKPAPLFPLWTAHGGGTVVQF